MLWDSNLLALSLCNVVPKSLVARKGRSVVRLLEQVGLPFWRLGTLMDIELLELLVVAAMAVQTLAGWG